nr:hypothetical protein [uncultured Janthinobacterium sp.]
MSAIVGSRDKRLQATAERFSTTADGKAILMSGSTPVFRVTSAGVGSPGSIAITAKPVNVAGDIVFSVSAGTTLAINGNVATVDFATMTTDTVTVQARIREFGVDYIANYIISKVFDGVAGDTGLAGLNTGQAFAYKRAAAAPTDSPGDVIFTFAAAAVTTPAGNDLANGWSKNIPAGSAPLYVRVAGASSRNATDNISANEWAAAVQLAKDGADGADGTNTAQAFAYKRAAAAPVDSPGDVVYTFATAAISTPAGNGLANGWSKTIPAGTAPLYVRVAAASSRSATDAIAANEWTAAVLLAQDGTAGQNGQNGLNVAPVRIYQRAAANVAPALPTAACTFTFATGVLTGLNNGWSTQVPTAGGAYLFTSGASAASTAATDDIPAGEWAAAARMAADGNNGTNGVDGLNVAPVRIYQRGATNIAPALPSAACTFTFATGALAGLNNGWSTQVPTAGGAYLFTSGATAASHGATDDIPASEWSAAARLAADGATGQRGTVTVTAPGYSAWSDASAVYELGHAGYGAPINRDVVTLYDATHAVTKFYVDGDWLEAGTVINGSLLVDGSIAGKSLAADNLGALIAKLGKVIAGDISASTIHGGSGYPSGAWGWPSNGGYGFHLSEAGLLMGNYAAGKYSRFDPNGDIYTPQFKVVSGAATFSGMLSAVSGSFELIRSPGRAATGTGAGYDLTKTGFYFFDENNVPRVEIGEF